MKNKTIKIVLSLLLVFTALLSLPLSARAASSEVRFEDGKLLVFAPGSVYTSSDLFDGFKGVMPGDVRSEEVTIENKSKDCDYIKVYMRAILHDKAGNPISPAVLKELTEDQRRGAMEELAYMHDFLSQLSMKVWNGTKLIYSASPDELDGLAENVFLAELRRGENTKLKVELSVPLSLGNEYSNRIGEVDWLFVAEGYDDTTELTVLKQWKDSGKNRPGKVTVTLYNGKESVNTVELGPWNNWTYTWTDLDKDGDWKVYEINVPKGYTPTYTEKDGMVLVLNTATLIQTGQLNWPIPVLGGLGLLFLGYGVFLMNRKRKNESAQ